MSGITKALILTDAPVEADRWRTLGVHARPLVPLANRPVVLHTLDALRAAGVREATVLADGALRDVLREVLGRGTPDLAIRFADHVDEQALDARALVVEPADALLRAPLDGVLGEISADDIDGAVLRLPAPATSSVTEVAACVLGQDAAVAVARDLDGSDGTVETVAEALVAGSRRVRVGEVRGCRACTGGDDGLLHANRMILESLITGDPPQATLIGSEVQGAALIHPTARLESTLVRGPAVIGPGAHLTDAYIGPSTSIGEDVFIEGAEIEHSLVLAGAEIRYPGARLTSSIVGPRARLVRDFHLPRGMRLTIGADSVVAVS